MQKDFKDFTVGELLDMGLDVDVYAHRVPSFEKAKDISRNFEGTKQSSHSLDKNTQVVTAKKEKFYLACFVTKEE